ncbi:MAG: anti-sigma regulatory factor [Pseudomonadota bacterium]
MRSQEELGTARRLVGEWAVRLAYSTLERTKLVTATSELARNTLVHGLGGTMTIAELRHGGRVGLELVFEDQGPGIPDMKLALTDGFSTARSLGLGLGGARRLVNEFEIDSEPGRGTKIVVKQWKRA